MHSDPMSEIYQRRLSRARQVIDNTLTVHSIVRSLRENTLRHHMDMRSTTTNISKLFFIQKNSK